MWSARATHPPSASSPSQVGGLADVVTGLARAHQATGTLAELVLPKYDCGDYSALTDLRVLGQLSVPWRGGLAPVAVWAAVCGGVPAYLLEPAPAGGGGAPPFWRGAFYCGPDDASRFLLFAAAAVEFLAWSGRAPDVVHAHDWPREYHVHASIGSGSENDEGKATVDVVVQRVLQELARLEES